jgi:hypothetical protein
MYGKWALAGIAAFALNCWIAVWSIRIIADMYEGRYPGEGKLSAVLMALLG